MPLIETEGLVLKTYNLAEADRIVLLLTHEHGLVRGVAKGAKRLRSKFGSGLEPYSVVRLTYFQKDTVELVSIQQAELLKSYFAAAAAEPRFLQKFAYLIDLLTSITPLSDPNEDLYRMVKACLDASAQMPDRLDRIALYFELWLLRLGGYLPDWRCCDNCRKPIEENALVNLQANFQLLCGDCKKVRGGTLVSGRMRELFETAQRLSPVKFGEYVLDDTKIVAEISEILRVIFASVIGREVTGERSFVLGD